MTRHHDAALELSEALRHADKRYIMPSGVDLELESSMVEEGPTTTEQENISRFLLTTETPYDRLEKAIEQNLTDGQGVRLSIEDCQFLQQQQQMENLSLSNITCQEHAPQFSTESQVKAIVLGVMALLSLVGNTATIVSIAREKRRSRSTVYTLIHHLAVADLFVTFSCLTTESIWTYTVQWLAGNALCKLVKFLQMFSLYLSTFILVLIGMDRFNAVRYPMRRSDTQRRCVYGIAFVWLLSGLLSIPQPRSLAYERVSPHQRCKRSRKTDVAARKVAEARLRGSTTRYGTVKHLMLMSVTDDHGQNHCHRLSVDETRRLVRAVAGLIKSHSRTCAIAAEDYQGLSGSLIKNKH
ncbi:prolactin-releasing peptide receptor-like [Penaeus japonicus]|uniref:prolactin-releasing peptide receptor-like n=1 Tax=Penaeus japonicus TaxID=27405 RepID=UPI001C71159A|nr:prolactin-releasing peptide receptor-like [Penaeus japonicus]